MTPQRSRTLIYTYCVINRPKSELKLRNAKGFGEPHLICFQDLAAVVSEVPASRFNQQEIDKKLKDTRWLTDGATRHEGVLEEIMRATTPIPMKFCTIFTSKERALEMLRQEYKKFSEILKRIEGRVELGLTGYSNLRQASRKITESNRRIEKLREQIAKTTPGRAYFLKRELEELTVAEAQGHMQALANEIFSKLRKHSDNGVMNMPFGSETAQQRAPMILNTAHLVRKNQIQPFKAQFKKTKSEYGRLGVKLRLSGPWPPYNFC